MKLKTAILFAAVVAGPAVAIDIDGDVTFDGIIGSTCVILGTTLGVLDHNPGLTILSSEEGVGLPAQASVISTDTNNTVTLIAPTSFTTQPAGGGDNVTFDADYSLTGATIIADVNAGTLTNLNVGLTSIDVEASATKSSGVFPGGVYELDVTVRCSTP